MNRPAIMIGGWTLHWPALRALTAAMLLAPLVLCAQRVTTPGRYGLFDTDLIAPAEYRDRRDTLMSRMEDASVAVFRAAEAKNRNGDVDYRYRQNSSLLYLTGCTETGATLLLVPGGVRIDSVTTARAVLFVRPAGHGWTGENLGVEGAADALGFGTIDPTARALPSDQFAEIFARAMVGARTLYYVHTLPDIVLDPVSGKRFVTAREVRNELASRFPGVALKNLYRLLGAMRLVKSPEELRLLQHAIDATTDGQIEAMKSCEPDWYEYQLQAVVEYCFARRGAEYVGFPSIIGSGPNALSFHYDADRRQMRSGELVVMDIGAEYHGYSADVTRTIPVSGKFSPEQRALYEIVLQAHDEAIREMRTGALPEASSKRAFAVLTGGLKRLGIITEDREVRTYCPHGVSHPIGLEVHDVGQSGDPLPRNAVLTMEPGLYVPEGSPCDRKYWNIGIRIEDDVLVTDEGGNVLSGNAPRTVDDIERLMQKKGIGNQPVGSR